MATSRYNYPTKDPFYVFHLWYCTILLICFRSHCPGQSHSHIQGRDALRSLDQPLCDSYVLCGSCGCVNFNGVQWKCWNVLLWQVPDLADLQRPRDLTLEQGIAGVVKFGFKGLLGLSVRL